LKSQLKIADKYGAQLTLFLGQKEALEGTVLIRNMETGRQETVKLESAVAEIKKRLKK
jgi:histidyl-tRNA synthetase